MRPIWNEPRPVLRSQLFEGNTFIVTRAFSERPDEGKVIYATPHLPDYHLLRPNAVAIPVLLKSRLQGEEEKQGSLFEAEDSGVTNKANLSEGARGYLASLGFPDPDADLETAKLIWLHALAIGYSPAYLRENADGIKFDWPRIPLPTTSNLLKASAELGRKVAALLDTEQSLKLPMEVLKMGLITRKGGGNLNPATDLVVTAGWGNNSGGVTMPMKGKVEYRASSFDKRLGDRVVDVYLNDRAFWQDIPERVWEYVIGGYQVIKKWLSYREKSVLGRALRPDEAREVTRIVQRIAALVLLEEELDKNYLAVKNSISLGERERSAR